MKTPTRVLGALTVITIAGIAAAVVEPPSSHGTTDKPAAKTKAPTQPKTETTKPTTTDTKEPAPAKTVDTGAKATEAAAPTQSPTPEQVMTMLEEGNARWVSSTEKGPRLDAARRKDVTDNGQKPVASIVTCSDSRIPVEHVFDQGVGDLFVVRVAGNTAGGAQTGSVEYGVEHLKTPVLVVLGHTKCGAVSAAATNAAVHGNIKTLVDTLGPSVERAQKLNPTLKDKDLVPAAIRENVWQTVFDLLKTSEPCRAAVAKGDLRVVGAVYDIGTGKVEWMGEHPWQSELIAAFTKEPQATQEAAVGGHSSDEHH